MSDMYKIVAGMGVLIGIYLFVRNAGGATQIIDTIGTKGVNAISTLQGR